MEAAIKAAAGKDIPLGGGAQVLRGFLSAGLLDSLHPAMVPVLLASGERVFDTKGVQAGYRRSESTTGKEATHLHFVGN